MNVGGWFARRPPLAPEERARLAREEQRRHELAAQALALREQEAEAARVDEEQTRESAQRIAAACRAQGYWWPRAPIPESRLSPRLSWGERALENLRETWRGMTR